MGEFAACLRVTAADKWAAMSDDLLIGIDVGTTSVKAALFDAHGSTRAAYASSYAMRRPKPAHVEQDPADWMRHVLAALSQLATGHRVSAVGLCSQVNTHVFVDASGTALMPAIIWQDGRCAEEAARLDALVPTEDRIAWWGAPLPIDASHVLSRMAWVARHHPDIWARTRWVLAPKDYCLLKLTGEVYADPLTSFAMVDKGLRYIPKLLGLVPDAALKLPPLAPFTEMVGRIKSGLPGAGLPMVTGTMDAWSGLLGAGVALDGEAMYLSGTSEVGGIVSRRKVPTPGVIAFPECEGITLHAGPTQAGGAAADWVANLLGRSPEEISQLVAHSDPYRPAPIFLPHLQGERAPIWDIAARASFSAIDASMGPAEFARAVYEGVAYSVRWLFEALEHSAALRPALINHSGGGARSDAWCQIRADVLGIPLRRTANLNSGVLGAAILAGAGARQFASIPEAVRALVRFDRVFQPEPRMREHHDARFAAFKALYGQLRSFNAAIGRHPPSPAR
jgi:xylulokinase